MNRAQLIQNLIENRGYKTYMEIGVLGGNVFFPIKCQRKVAVDPVFQFNWKGKLGQLISNPINLNAQYFQMTSDDFFKKHGEQIFKKRKLDIALVDGMHEFKNALADTINCMRYLSNGGVVVLHDCNPASYEASVTYEEWKERNFDGFWNGDVWKVILYLRTAYPKLTIFVGDCDHGLGIIAGVEMFEGEIDPQLFDKINRLSYYDFDRNRAVWLNLKSKKFLEEFGSKTYD